LADTPLPYLVDDPFVAFKELPQYGIPFTRLHLLRLMRQGKFPRSYQITNNRVGWRRCRRLTVNESRAGRPHRAARRTLHQQGTGTRASHRARQL